MVYIKVCDDLHMQDKYLIKYIVYQYNYEREGNLWITWGHYCFIY